MAQEVIWQGSSSFASGQTPWGLYDSDSSFSSDIDKFSDWCARRLGYPIMSVELQSGSFYACFEESISEYSAQVNQFNIKDNLLHLTGQATSSTDGSHNVTHKRVTPTLGRNVFLSKQYGTEAGVGGDVDYKKGSINITSGSQEYDLNALFADVSESGQAIEVKRVYYEGTPAMQRFFDPYATTGYGTLNMVQGFGFGNYSPAVSFTLMPLFEDLLRVQAIELNDSIRKSAYSFTLVNNKVRLFPDPETNSTLYFDYVKTSERDNPLITEYGGSTDVVSDYSNVPYNNMEYQFINDVGKQWIRKYGLALTKELLGIIRSKYGTIPIPNADTTLDGDTLRAEAAAEKEGLVSQLREILEQMSRKALLEADKDEAEYLQEKLSKVPYPIYIG